MSDLKNKAERNWIGFKSIDDIPIEDFINSDGYLSGKITTPLSLEGIESHCKLRSQDAKGNEYVLFNQKLNNNLFSSYLESITLFSDNEDFKFYFFDCEFEDKIKCGEIKVFFSTIDEENKIVDIKNTLLSSFVLFFKTNDGSFEIRNLNMDGCIDECMNIYSNRQAGLKTVKLINPADTDILIKAHVNKLKVVSDKENKVSSLIIETKKEQKVLFLKDIRVETVDFISSYEKDSFGVYPDIPKKSENIPDLDIKHFIIEDCEIDYFKKETIPFSRNIEFRNTKFKAPFLFYGMNDQKYNPNIIQTENITFSCQGGNDGKFNKIKVFMKKLGYEVYAMDFQGFASKSRYNSLQNCSLEKSFLWVYGSVSDYGLNLGKMFYYLAGFFGLFSIIYLYFLCDGIESIQYSFVNSLGFLKFAFPSDYMEGKASFSLALISFIHISFASIIWYLIIMWLKKRFGQK